MKAKMDKIKELFKNPTPSKLEEADRLIKQLVTELKKRRESIATDEKMLEVLIDARSKVEAKAKTTPIDELKAELESMGITPTQKKEEPQGASGRFGHAVGNFLAEAKKALGDQKKKDPEDE